MKLKNVVFICTIANCEHFVGFEEFIIFNVKTTFQRRGNLVINSKIFFSVPLVNTLKNVIFWLTLIEALGNFLRARNFWVKQGYKKEILRSMNPRKLSSKNFFFFILSHATAISDN